MDTTDSNPLVFRFGKLRLDFTSRTHVMGILNMTPDSFSGSGSIPNVSDAISIGVQMQTDGADIVDIGGESTRPGAEPVPVEEELKRVLPVIKGLVKELSIPISVDTSKSDVARAAADEGVQIVNDVTAGMGDPAMIPFAADAGMSMVLMHMKGTPRTMQENPTYKDVSLEVAEYLLDKAITAERAGVRQIIIDPGLGFGKSFEHNVTLMRDIPRLRTEKYPVLVGPSRKSFIGKILDLPVEERLEGTAAVVAACIFSGAHLIRVHDVREMKRVAQVCDALKPLSPHAHIRT